MSTIEPRLITLLNTDALLDIYPPSPSLELPPLHDPNILKASGRPLVLEPDCSKRTGNPQHANLVSSVEEDGSTHKSSGKRKAMMTERALGNSSPQSLRKILDDNSEGVPSLTSKKRTIAESSKDDFVQLPQPPKKQKAVKQVVPPIIIGLHEPPPQNSLFPPIASSSFHDSHGRNSLNTVPLKPQQVKENPCAESAGENNVLKKVGSKEKPKPKPKKEVKARKKWSEDETNNLLLGVAKHGVGRWLNILEDSSFTFDGRSSVDLKDRFRTCCPVELRGKIPKAKDSSQAMALGSKSSLLSENILITESEASTNEGNNTAQDKARRTRTHRKNAADLAQLGIEGPFAPSQRRERRLFTEVEDNRIRLGFVTYGPAWARIQKDPRFGLQGRVATDIRDRYRCMFPEKCKPEDAGSPKSQKTETLGKETSATLLHTGSTLQPMSSREGLRIHHIISENHDTKVYPSQQQVPNYGFKDNFASYPDQHADVVDSLPSFDWNNNAPFASSIGEMDISRLLLDVDEPWMQHGLDNTSGKERQSFTDINSILSSGTDGYNQVSSYYDMLVNNDHMNMAPPGALEHDTSFP